MLKNYIIIALRNFIRQKLYSLINVLGLAIGIACFILIMLWVTDELSYNKFNENYDEIYRVINYHSMEGPHFFSNSPNAMGPELKKKYPEIIEFVRYNDYSGIVKYGDKYFNEPLFIYGDPALFRIFTFPIVKGNPETCFDDVYSIAISERAAKKYFGDEDPLGKVLIVDNEDEFVVRAVFETIPENSSVRFDFFVPFGFLEKIGFYRESWHDFSWQTYIQVLPNTDMDNLKAKVKDILLDKMDDEVVYVRLQPLKELHLYKRSGEKGGIIYVYTFTAIAFFILILACINFMNLSTARSIRRAREIGLRKTVGAQRGQIILQFLGESLLLSFIALIVAMMFVEVFRPGFNVLTGKELSIDYFDLTFIVFSILTGLITGLLAGIYPAFYISGFKPIKVLRFKLSSDRTGFNIRRVLVVFQFTITLILIIGSLTIYRQLNYILNKDLGFETENIVFIEMNQQLKDKFEVFKQEIAGNPSVLNITRTMQMPTFNRFSTTIDWIGRNPDEFLNMNISVVDFDYVKTFGLEIVEGRDFAKDFSTDSSNYIINQKAAEVMRMENPVSQKLILGDTGTIIGVVKDYNFMPMRYDIEPITLAFEPDYYSYVVVKLHGHDTKATMEFIETVFYKNVADVPFDYTYLESDFDVLYRTEKRLSKIILYFMFLAIFIACLGLFGLASFMAEQRTKEIGIRKAHGATVGSIILFMSKEYIKWVLIAVVIASPVAFYILKGWLGNYKYTINQNPLIYLGSGFIAIIIALLTVSFQAWKSARKNPVEALRYE